MSTWHADEQVLAQYATVPGAVDDVTAASIEAHLLRCEECRHRVAVSADATLVDDSWHAIADLIDRPRRGAVERVLGWFLPDEVARVVAATAALRVAWLAAMTVVVGAAVATARAAGTDMPFLLLAPLVPLAGIAMSFGPAPDPAGEAALAAPLQGAGLVLRRAVAVLVSSGVVLLAGTVALPGLEWRAAGWVLPAVGLTLTALALSTWITPFAATAAAGTAWVVLVQAATIVDGAAGAVTDGPLFGPAAQVAFLALAGVAAVAVGTRRTYLCTVEAR